MGAAVPGFAGFVLVGGQSVRMGADKALLAVQEAPLAVRVARRVAAAAGSATLVGSCEKYAHLDWPVIEDLLPGRGPLSGVHAALKHSPARWNLVVGCDLPFLTEEFLAFLLGIAEKENARVIVPASERHGFESLVAVYHADCLEVIEATLLGDDYQLARVFEKLRPRAVGREEWAPFDRDGRLFDNVNTPEDLERARTGA